MKNKSGIYEIRNAVNNKKYVGQAAHIRKRWEQHRWYLKRGLHHSSPLQRAWDKYGEAAFEFRVVLLCSVSNLDMYEQLLFDKTKPEYNVAPIAGSCRGVKRPPEKTAYLIGNTYSLGFKHPPEFGAAISARNKGRKQHPDHVAKSSVARTGAKRSLESRDRMRDAHLGKTRSRESIEKQIASTTGKKFPPEFSQAVSLAKRAANDAKRPPSARTLQRRAEFDAAHGR